MITTQLFLLVNLGGLVGRKYILSVYQLHTILNNVDSVIGLLTISNIYKLNYCPSSAHQTIIIPHAMHSTKQHATFHQPKQVDTATKTYIANQVANEPDSHMEVHQHPKQKHSWTLLPSSTMLNRLKFDCEYVMVALDT